MQVLSGVAGSTSQLSSLGDGNAGMYTSGSCLAGYRTFFPGSRLVFSLFLGESAVLGGILTVTTCGLTKNNTVLYVGRGCPTWSEPFGCLAGTDDDEGACLANRLASTVRIVAAQRNYFFQVGGINGNAITTALNWSYVPPVPSSRSRTATSRVTPTGRSRSATQTRTRKRKL